MMKNLFRTAHIEKMKSKIASIKYCSKEDTRTGKIYTNMDLAKYKVDTDTDTVEVYVKPKTLSEEVNYRLERMDILTKMKFEDKETYEYIKVHGDKIDKYTIETIEELASLNL